MFTIKLPDGKNLSFSNKVTGLEVAKKISKSLLKQALIISIDGELKDLNYLIDKDCSIKIITSKDNEGLETIRHDTAHILAMAVQEIFSETQVTIGPVIENGFYYDFARKESFTKEDLNKIENKMKEIVDRDEPTFREVWKRDKAISHFREKGETYKAEIIESIPKEEDVSLFLEKANKFAISPVFLHGVYLVNLGNSVLLEKSINSLTQHMLVASSIKAKGVIFHCGSRKGFEFEEVLVQISDSITEVLKSTPDDVSLIFENSAGMGSSIGSKFEEIIDLLGLLNDD